MHPCAHVPICQVTNRFFVSPPPSPPLPPPSPPPNVLLQLNLENYYKGTVNPQAWPEGTMEVVVQSAAAAHGGNYGLLIEGTNRWSSEPEAHPLTPAVRLLAPIWQVAH